jgi:hypothetical protein
VGEIHLYTFIINNQRFSRFFAAPLWRALPWRCG